MFPPIHTLTFQYFITKIYFKKFKKSQTCDCTVGLYCCGHKRIIKMIQKLRKPQTTARLRIKPKLCRTRTHSSSSCVNRQSPSFPTDWDTKYGHHHLGPKSFPQECNAPSLSFSPSRNALQNRYTRFIHTSIVIIELCVSNAAAAGGLVKAWTRYRANGRFVSVFVWCLDEPCARSHWREVFVCWLVWGWESGCVDIGDTVFEIEYCGF